MFKKRIGITQRVMQHPRYNEVMDCLDTSWASYLATLNILAVPLPLIDAKLVEAQWEMLKLDGLIISGGNTITAFADSNDSLTSLSLERDQYESALIKAAINTYTPILGICRGLQMINVFHGGELVKIKGHAGTYHELKHVDTTGIVLPKRVNSYHDCAIPLEKLGNGLVPLAYDQDGHVEALKHTEHQILGIMWHPEREDTPAQEDNSLIKGFFET